MKTKISFLFLVYWFLCKFTGCQRCQKISLSLFFLIHASEIENGSFSAFYTCVYSVLHICSVLSNHSNELNYLKSLGLSREFNPSNIDKTLNKFKKPEYSICYSEVCLCYVVLPFQSSIISKIFLTLSRFCYNVSFKPFDKIQFFSPKDPISTMNKRNIYFIPYFSLIFVTSEEICSSSIAFF